MKVQKSNTTTQATSEVLFQKMGSTWYVFTEVSGDMVYSALPSGMDPHTTNLELFEVIEDHMQKVSKHYGRKPEVAA
jgi:RES domain-containing protein